jgi:hypothetical protein
MKMQHEHGHGNAVGTWICNINMDFNMDMDMQHWKLICRMDLDKRYGLGHADRPGHSAWTWTCIVDTDKQHEHICCMDMDLKNGYGHATWT